MHFLSPHSEGYISVLLSRYHERYILKNRDDDGCRVCAVIFFLSWNILPGTTVFASLPKAKDKDKEKAKDKGKEEAKDKDKAKDKAKDKGKDKAKDIANDWDKANSKDG